MTLAITGGTGFVGSHVLDLALAAGQQPQALTRRLGATHPATDAPQPSWIAGTLADASALARG